MKLKKLILFIIIFSIISTYATEYEVLENIHLGNSVGTILTKIEDNTYFIKHRKTINKIVIDNNGFEIIDTKYFEKFICKPIIHNNLLIAPSWFNNIDIYQITDNDLILINSLGLETCEEYIINYYATNLCGNYIFYRYYLYNFETELWENHMDIYDMENNYELIVSEVMDTQNIVVEVIKIGDIYYFFRKNGDIGYTDNEAFDMSSLDQVTYAQPSNLYLEGASWLENKLYIYFTNYENGIFKIYNFENDSILVEETSIELPFIWNPKFLRNNNYLYIWGWDSTGSDTIMRKYYISESEYILENQETYYDQYIGSIIQLEGNYLVFGGSQIFFMDSDLNTIEIIQDDLFDIYIIDTMLDRFILLKINELTGSDYLFYDIIDHEYLDFSLPDYYWYHYQFQKRSFDNYFLFQSGNHLKVIYFYEDGDYEIFDYSIPETSYDADIYNNIIAIETIQGDDHYCTFYQVINDELEYLNSTMLNHYVHALLFVDNEHIAIMETYMGNIFIYYYRMNPDYSLDIIDSFQVYSSEMLMTLDKIICPANGSPVIDITDPDNPEVIDELNLPYYGNGNVRYNGSNNFLFDTIFQVGITDNEFSSIDCWGDVAFTFFIDEDKIIISNYDHLTIAELPYITSVGNEIIPFHSSSLLYNYPNPFNPAIAGDGRSPETTISFNLDSECEIELSVYNIKGQKVNSIYEGTIAAGEHSLNWNGKDNNGKRLAAGVYIISLEYKDTEIVRKMLMLK